jgi:RNA recognition motif-containing protein
MGEKLFVGNLAYGTSDQDLRELFSTVGTCVSATVLMDRETGKSRGFGFVEMSSASEAQRAISQLNDSELQGRRISVSEARERGAAAPPRGDSPSRSYRPPRSDGSPRSFGPDSPPSRPRFRKEGGSRRGVRARKRSL